MISEPSRCGLSERPAPEVPVTAVMTTSGAASPAASAGYSASVATVGKQPGTATRFVPCSAARAPGSSGSPYGQVPACEVP